MTQAAILGYINHLEDPAYLARLLDMAPMPALVEQLGALLRSGDAEHVAAACLIIRDLTPVVPRHELGSAFRAAFASSPLVAALEELVLTGDRATRAEAIYTLGKTGCVASAAALRRAFDALYEADPLVLPRLVGEIWWLEGQHDWALIDTMVASRSYATRWAALAALSTWSGNTAFQAERQRRYAALRQDAHPLVRAEADFAYQELLLEQRLPSLPLRERRAQRAALERDRPRITFADMGHRFSAYLHARRQGSYTLEMLSQFLDGKLL
ncbi:hypothetical protein F8S13_19370 [Chloroflexia bacterium SDU3-3]|nr:hypothetical protein F8S13_19370 [Chloroflexia bacterium SDU3-3]